MRFLFPIVIAINLANPVFANDGPSYQETVDYIIERTGDSGVNNASGTRYEYWISFPKKCVLHKENREEKNGRVIHHYRISVSLKDIDPNEVRGNEKANWVYLNARERKEKFSHQWLKSKNGYTGSGGTSYSESVKPRNASDVPRLIRAFSHLVKICGGKKELF